ncbi:hypothetical protein SVI_1678 [Shewanella violacea DSS12]|uniref:Uncharacterized protein n=1 Tax=Shewanella violacea (strain JCM 10179 / CIP 106290 / LMG 19151 / DSS12) TaxID=637905 RepID=D4ZJ00_SHEVD|nr:hypothetical protein SVI_1678 [Shewanella violacea DSS12]
MLLIISENIGPRNLFSLVSAREYNGSVTKNGFLISKNIYYRNSFLPLIEGKVKPSINGSHIIVTMRLHALVLCFMFVWFCGVGIGCVAVLSHLDNFSFPLLIPFIMLFSGIIIVSGGFWFEASKQKTKLVELLTKN